MKFSHNSQELKIHHQYSHLVIMVSKVTLSQLKTIFWAWVHMLYDNWRSESDQQQSWLITWRLYKSNKNFQGLHQSENGIKEIDTNLKIEMPYKGKDSILRIFNALSMSEGKLPLPYMSANKRRWRYLGWAIQLIMTRRQWKYPKVRRL